MKVAVIDDEPDLRGIIRDFLVSEDYDVVEANDGITGVEIIKNELPDLIICDVKMPKMNGDELFEIIRNSGHPLNVIPFIFLSGNANQQESISRLNLGAANCLDKPINLALLSAHIKSQIGTVKRVSHFFKEQLDTIADSLHSSVKSDFENYGSIFTNAQDYVETIIALIQQLSTLDQSPAGKAVLAQASPLNKQLGETQPLCTLNSEKVNRLSYIDFFLNEYQERKQLIRTTNGEDLSWLLIYLVTKAQIEGNKIPVSDLYISTQAAKTTTHARINALIDDGIFQKLNDLSDGRRQLMSLTEQFQNTLLRHIDSNLGIIATQSP